VGGAVKRTWDILLSGTAILLLSPLLAVIALAVVLQSRGPAFFLQRRGGYRGRPFLVYKFRTMTVADDGDEIDQAKRGDSRVTWLGAILRKASLDELPQLFNVFRGDMSIVGPRPHAIAHDRKFAAWAPEYRHRGVARPGITGLAQVNGSRGLVNTPEELKERVRLDLAYTARWSLWLDVLIIVRTVLVIFRDPKAH
jgi:lipopolysaccharide/colanic/teichoic acid biosynthesis glycosyltransferase